jgi:ubiquinone/menaquinone biosynthesis C-methylase UbiE
MTNKDKVSSEKKFWDAHAKRYDKFISLMGPRIYDRLYEELWRDILDSEILLEIGTGTGLISLNLSDSVSDIIAIDFSDEMIKLARRKAAERSIKNINFRVEDACHLSFPDNLFDTVIASNVLHLLTEPDKAIQEMKRVLSPGGKIIVPTFCHGQNILSHALSRLSEFSGFKPRTRWSEKSFKSYVESFGLEISYTTNLKGMIPLIYIVAKQAHS